MPSHDVTTSLDPLETNGVKVIHWMLPISALAMLASWIVLSRTHQLNFLDKFFAWPMILAMLGLELAFLRNWLTSRQVLYATWGSWATYIVFAIGYETYLGDYEPGLSASVLWFTVVSLLSLILFPKQYVLRIAVIYNCVGVLALGIGLWFNADVNPKTYNWVVQFVAANIIFVFLLNLYLNMRDRLEEADSLAHSDSLTGLANRRHMQKLLELEATKAQSFQRPFSVLLLDLDFFKSINDQWGHAIGDQALREVSRLLSDLVRDSDTIARWGGEEFLALFPGATAPQAAQVAERLRETLSRSTIAGNLKLTISIGVAEYTPKESLETLLQHADIALYNAKEKGRNRVEVYG